MQLTHQRSQHTVKGILKGALVIASTLALFGCAVPNEYDELQGSPVSGNSAKPHERDTVSIGIAFGGGAARGVMHLGVIQALQEEGIYADVVTGTSVGSIAAVLYANNPDYDVLAPTILSFSDRAIKDFIISRKGLIQGKALADWVNNQIVHTDLSTMPVPVGIATTNLTTHEVYLFTGGNPGQAVQISSSVPGVFVPVSFKGDTFIDGGILSMVPVYGARDLGADIVIGIDVMCGAPPPVEPTAIGTLASTFWLQSCAEPQHEVTTADILITPVPTNTRFDDFGDDAGRREAIKNGYDATMAKMPEIKALLCEKDNQYCT
ncbi:patatin-like phospholipase family protein [Thaumasiovibrio subtropicus]|uniref:patatin-like phospholipase family protein n=1 Tax=Thaumasiovibrio subtropicus TaxID=1891207 RepID=UPI000B34F0F1|nr:patatin-like phospholipase family protein [Thaumasiovibrio subtropicus]